MQSFGTIFVAYDSFDMGFWTTCMLAFSLREPSPWLTLGPWPVQGRVLASGGLRWGPRNPEAARNANGLDQGRGGSLGFIQPLL